MITPTQIIQSARANAEHANALIQHMQQFQSAQADAAQIATVKARHAATVNQLKAFVASPAGAAALQSVGITPAEADASLAAVAAV